LVLAHPEHQLFPLARVVQVLLPARLGRVLLADPLVRSARVPELEPELVAE
jgi:hypothetical protein